MEPERANRILELVAETLEQPPEERASFLDEACGDDDALRTEVQSLVEQEWVAGEFLNTPALAREGGRLFDAEAGELKPDDTLGDCRIVRLLGEGGMGEVYLAQDTALERPVAVKLLKSQIDDDALVRRFRHERRVLAGLTHPNIARLYGGALTPEGRAYLVMEFVEGERLDHYCERKNLGVNERLTLFRKVCAAVAYAHQNLVVHRDLKPANIRVTADGEPKLLDFGIAKLLEEAGGESGADAGWTITGAMTPEYASPEQVRGGTITTASDVYSLGVILYELLCGQRPHQLQQRRPDELARAICEEEPPWPSTVAGRATTVHSDSTTTTPTTPGGEPPARVRRRLEGDLDNIVATALRKEPARRYGSVAQFSEDIRRHAEELPVLARRDTVGYRLGKFVRRNKTATGATALVLLALVGGLVLAAWQAHVADRERDHARLAPAGGEDAPQQADAARQQAETARKQAERINKFLERLLTSADPRKPGGKDMKVVDALDNASANIDHDLAGEPEVLAQVHSTLGLAYGRLQLLPQSEEQARAALAIFRRLHPQGDAVTALETEKLANTLNMRERYTEAEPLLRKALAWRREHGTADEYALARTAVMLATVFASTNRPHDAEPLITDALALFRKTRGEESTDYLMAVNLLGNAKLAEDDLDGALTQYRIAVAAYEKISPGNVMAVVPEINICNILFRQGKFAEEDLALEKAEKDCRQSVGENNVYYGTVLGWHGQLDFARGNYGQAAPRMQQALLKVAASYPADNEVVIRDEMILGIALTRTGRAAEAESILRKAASDGKSWKPAPAEQSLGNPEAALGECLLALKRYAEAEPLLVASYDDLQKRLGLQNPSTTQAGERLHDLYLVWNKPAEAARFAPAATNQTDRAR